VQASTGGPVCAQMDIHTLRFAALAIKNFCRENAVENIYMKEAS